MRRSWKRAARTAPDGLRGRQCTLWRKARTGEIECRAAGVLLSNVPDMPVRWGANETVSADAVRLALALDRPICDCVYLALAYRIGAVMLTADRRLANILASTEHGESILTLDDYATAR